MDALYSYMAGLTTADLFDIALQMVIFATGLWGQILITRHRIEGFYMWVVSNGCLVILHSLYFRPVMIVMQLVYLGFCIWGIIQWKKNKTQKDIPLF